MADEARSRLGRGLASLIGDVGGEAAHVERPRNQRKMVPIEFLKRNPRNPRRTFSDAELGELTTIKRRGVIQPIVVRPVKGAQIARDHRRRTPLARRRPARSADPFRSKSVTATHSKSRSSRTCSAKTSMRWKRRRAITRWRTSSNAARKTSASFTSRSHVSNMMRLTKLPAEVQAYIARGELSAGHARALIGVPDPLAAAKRIVAEGLNVRQTEALAHEHAGAQAAENARW